MMNQQPNFSNTAALDSGYNLRTHPNKEIFPNRSDLNKLERELQKRKRDALTIIKETQLRNTPKSKLLEQARIKAKQVIFQKYYNIIEKELDVLQVQLQSLNQYDNEYWEFFKITFYPDKRDMRHKLLMFESKLQWVRQSTCYFKYCYPTKSRCSCFVQWFCCWCCLPCFCYQKGCLKEDKCQIRLQQLYERYEQLIVAENQTVACPHQ